MNKLLMLVNLSQGPSTLAYQGEHVTIEELQQRAERIGLPITEPDAFVQRMLRRGMVRPLDDGTAAIELDNKEDGLVATSEPAGGALVGADDGLIASTPTHTVIGEDGREPDATAAEEEAPSTGVLVGDEDGVTIVGAGGAVVVGEDPTEADDTAEEVVLDVDARPVKTPKKSRR